MNPTKFSATSPEVVSFLAGCQTIVDADADDVAHGVNTIWSTRLQITGGGRYLKVVRESIHTPSKQVNSRSAHCFIDRTNGDVLKTASWSAPAKGARGNITDSNNGLARMNCYGAGYNR